MAVELGSIQGKKTYPAIRIVTAGGGSFKVTFKKAGRKQIKNFFGLIDEVNRTEIGKIEQLNPKVKVFLEKHYQNLSDEVKGIVKNIEDAREDENEDEDKDDENFNDQASEDEVSGRGVLTDTLFFILCKVVSSVQEVSDQGDKTPREVLTIMYAADSAYITNTWKAYQNQISGNN